MAQATYPNGSMRAYLALMRLDKPVGTLLLLWPTLAALFLAADGWPPWQLLVVFAIGTLLMRSAGCVINDYADRNVDGHVARTKARPLATGAITPRQAMAAFVVLILAAATLLLFLNNLTRLLAVGGLAIAMIYPFMKRWTYLPQVVLGAAFSWGLPMAYAAVTDNVPNEAWLLFTASLLWIVAYDTMYAMADREDDLKIGVKSTAILFGQHDRLMVAALQVATLVVLALVGVQVELGPFYYAGLIFMAATFWHQQQAIKQRQPDRCFYAFRNNTWSGFGLFAGVVADALIGWP